MKFYTGILVVLLFNCLSADGQQRTTPEEYINQYKDIAVREMKRMGVPASITLAQGILESESGNSELVKKSNNHFGIKCKGSWIAGGVKHDDDAVGECFRQYKSAEESYRDHSNFLRNSSRYAPLFQLKADDYKGWAHGLKKAGYATNPRYPELLIKNIEQYNLNQYTLSAIDEVPVFESSKFEDDKEQPVIDTIAVAPPQTAPVKQPEAEEEALYGSMVTEYGRRKVFVKQGTSLLAVATQYDVALTKLLQYNNLETDGILKESKWLYIDKEKHSVFAKKTNTGYHTVLAGEGLYAIAKKYNIKVEDLKKWNGLKDDKINPGQKLIVTKK